MFSHVVSFRCPCTQSNSDYSLSTSYFPIYYIQYQYYWCAIDRRLCAYKSYGDIILCMHACVHNYNCGYKFEAMMYHMYAHCMLLEYSCLYILPHESQQCCQTTAAIVRFQKPARFVSSCAWVKS